MICLRHKTGSPSAGGLDIDLGRELAKHYGENESPIGECQHSDPNERLGRLIHFLESSDVDRLIFLHAVVTPGACFGATGKSSNKSWPHLMLHTENCSVAWLVPLLPWIGHVPGTKSCTTGTFEVQFLWAKLACHPGHVYNNIGNLVTMR